jgi:hypothetical protein
MLNYSIVKAMSLRDTIHIGKYSVKSLLVGMFSKYIGIPTGVSTVVIFPDTKIRDVFVHAIEKVSGISPALESVSISADRVLYAPAVTKFICTVASEDMHKLLGQHSVVVGIEVPDRMASAEQAQQIFIDAGYEAILYSHAQPEFPEGLLVFLKVSELKGVVLMFWPRNQDVPLEVAMKLPQRTVWKDKHLRK